jgi:predicted acetyltransferase
MKIERAVKSDINGIRELWKEGFGESTAFLDFYFPRYFDWESALISRQDYGEISASAITAPFEMKLLENFIPATYILGVVTHPSHRKKGLSSALMKESLFRQKEEGILVSTLIPAEPYLFDIYSKYGFGEVFTIKEAIESYKDMKENLGKAKIFTKENEIPEALFESLYDFYTDAYKGLDTTLLKSQKDFELCINEFLIFEGSIMILSKEGLISAIGFIRDKLSPVYIKELLSIDAKSKQALINSVLELNKMEEILVKSPSEGASSETRLGMARIIDAVKILELSFLDKDIPLKISISDSLISDNNITFSIENKKLHLWENEKADFYFTINEFSSLALRYGLNVESFLSGKDGLRAYINLLLNE